MADNPSRIIECVPNFSEGRDRSVIYALEKASQGQGAALADYSADVNHNRSVFTVIGSPQGVMEAAKRMAEVAAQSIDLTRHSGEHPRMGAMDVCPFVPIRGVAMTECVDISRRVGMWIANELSVPVFLYEESATALNKRNLADIRRGQFEGMAQKMAQPEWAPDFGAPVPHPTAGVTAVGARAPLVAFNVNLGTGDVEVAKNIAKAVRGQSGGLKFCKAIGVKLFDRDVAQVSMNMVDCEGTPIFRAFELIKAEAARYGVDIIGSELIGLSPAKALIDCAEYYLRLTGFDFQRQVLENHLLQ